MALVERSHEVRRVERMLDRAHQGVGGGISIEGEAGIGKSVLCRRAAELAAAGGMTVLRAVGGEVEQGVAFGVVRQLLGRTELGPDAGEPVPGIDGHLALGLLHPGAHPPPDDQAAEFAINHSLYWVVATLAERCPVLLVVDDAQWADEVSLRFLAFLARRLGDAPVGLLLAVRTGEVADPGPLDLLRAPATMEVAVPRPLSVAGTAELFRDQLGVDDVAPAFAEECRRLCGGNPLYLGWLASELVAGEVAPTADSAGRLHDLAAGPVSLHVRSRLARVDEVAARVLRSVAALGPEADRAMVAELSGLPPATSDGALRELEVAQLLTVDGGVSFTHPLIGEAVHVDLDPTVRSELHRQAAGLLAADGQVAAAATHLLQTAPAGDPWVVETLVHAVGRATYAETTGSAVRLLRRALAEPPSAERRASVLLELGRAERLSATDGTLAHLEEVQQTADEVALIEQSTSEMFNALANLADMELRVHTIERGIVRIGHRDPAAALRLEALLIRDLLGGYQTFDRGVAELDAVLARPATVTPVLQFLRAWRAWIAYWAGEGPASEVRRLGLEALAAVGEPDNLNVLPLSTVTIHTLQHCDSLEATAHLDRMAAAARRAGRTEELATVMAVQANGAWVRGELMELEERATWLYDLTAAARLPMSMMGATTHLVHAALAAGDVETAQRWLTSYEEQLGGRDAVQTPWATKLRYLRAMVRSAQGRHREAVHDVTTELAVDRQLRVPSIGFKGDFVAVGILRAAGERHLAAEVAAEVLAVAERRGLASQQGTALVLAAAVEGGEPGIEMLGRACDLLAGSPRRYEHAEALLGLGSALRRAGRRVQARPVLHEAFGMATAAGAVALAERARQELETAGTRTVRVARPAEGLSPAERRVADLAGQGLSNPQIAEHLFLSRRTVEAHLRAILRKLGIGPRQQIRKALGEAPD